MRVQHIGAFRDPKTHLLVETHRRNLQEKLNLHSVPELILYAVRKGIIA